MLDASIWGEPVLPFVSPNVRAHIACEPWQRNGYFALRRAIFVEEQGLFDGSDVDDHDRVATMGVATAHNAGMPDEIIGGVRIYPDGGGVWYGGRLGVAQRYRTRGVAGTALVFAAVSTAHAWRCQRFLATVQAANVRYFERHHFRALAGVEMCGQPHVLMEADLGAYPAWVAHAQEPVDGALAAAHLAGHPKRRAA
jgi:putative N-acetyltransferase (TIGR04045 family)